MPLRPYQLHCNFLRTTPSCLVECGGTRVLCTASITEGVPPFLKGAGKGWLTAEYAMLPASTRPRKARDGVKKDGRGVEISRLIGRALRQAVDLTRLGERTITIDCDVLEADGGTRTASITGGFVALTLAIDHLIAEKKLFASPIVRQIAAVSVGIIDGEPQLDLCYAQDSRADVDMNVVMDEKGNFIEVQGTGEGAVFSRPQLNTLLDLAADGISQLHAIQRQALGDAAQWIAPKLPRLLFATGNAHKVRELSQILKDHYQVLSLKDVGLDVDVEEDGDTFAANARIKAETICRMTGIAALADDSGLVVDALDGAPGVHSARYAGQHGDDEANLWLVLKNMEGVPDEKRSCRFVCAMALARPGMETLITEGAVEGMMAHAPRGEGGFGYDPIFIYRDGLTFSEVSAEEKNAVSHRAQAARKIVEALC